MARILVGVTGGVAAYKAVELVRLATKKGHAVRVLQTQASERFVGRSLFEAISGAPVLVDDFERDPTRGAFPGDQPAGHDPIEHLELVRRAEVYVLAPASANTLAKMAAGLADNLVTTAYLACSKPVLVAPAMNDRMWEHPATQANIEVLRDRGVHIAGPVTGELASRGEWGVGRLMEPEELLREIEQLAYGPEDPQSLAGLKVMVTAGGTREPIDAVRFIGNRSSGRMGFALADAAANRGAAVTVLAANVSLPRNPAVTYVDTPTSEDLKRATMERFPECDLLFMAAAVADFKPAASDIGKISRENTEELSIQLESTPDILGELSGDRRPDQLMVGFAAEYGNGAIDRARGKMKLKGVDAIVVNDISREDVGFESEENEVTLVSDSQEKHLPRASKAKIATEIVDWAAGALRAGRQV